MAKPVFNAMFFLLLYLFIISTGSKTMWDIFVVQKSDSEMNSKILIC